MNEAFVKGEVSVSKQMKDDMLTSLQDEFDRQLQDDLLKQMAAATPKTITSSNGYKKLTSNNVAANTNFNGIVGNSIIPNTINYPNSGISGRYDEYGQWLNTQAAKPDKRIDIERAIEGFFEEIMSDTLTDDQLAEIMLKVQGYLKILEARTNSIETSKYQLELVQGMAVARMKSDVS